ncbi:heat-labile enterotoxin alpha chain domain-containing protein [Hirsutella rhossiliensis]|uniref:Heat-labile enterotoxin alpha chain domain-containing protein n=1 Tax=Hirsutella rhossiliensis TaxID=111463 RepID=A0A9P8MXQ4_9HYPO|nr:heat-labile enterotoxin alpha chain domain-containing protein [Hirsutella rhossiliensis]KAH0963175.1 heat-labile enterotoxin alpha chain domain-containing protein [Hirsutella rhossiliensis]
MKSFGSSLALWAAIFLLLGFGESLLLPQDARNNLGKRGLARFVFRGETGRTDRDVEKAGGISSRGFEKHARGELSNEELEKGCSLFLHAQGVSPTNPKYKENTQYVSTSPNPADAITFAYDRGDPTKPGFMYVIAVDEKMIDVGATLGNLAFKSQTEYAAVGAIPHSQIVGHFRITAKDFDPGLSKKLQDGKYLHQLVDGKGVDGFQKNPRFDRKFLSRQSSGAQPQLAGIPADNSAWNQKPWNRKPLKDYKGKSVANFLGNFVWQKVCRRDQVCDQRFRLPHE